MRRCAGRGLSLVGMSHGVAVVVAVSAGGVFGLTSTATAQRKIEVVYAITPHATGSPKTAVSGPVLGAADPRFINFSELNRSPNGKTWSVLATTNALPNTQDQLMLIGTGLTTTRFFQEGVTQVNTGLPAEFLNIGTSLVVAPRVNDAGQWAAGFRLAVAGATIADDRLAIWDGVSFSLTKTGDTISASAGGGSYGGNFNSAFISSTGGASYLAVVSPNSTSFDSAFTASGATRLVDMGITVPSGQLTGVPVPWVDIDTNAFFTNSDGTRYLALGEVGLDTTTDKVVVVDGSVVVQKGFPVAGVLGNVSGVSQARMETSGDYYVRGTSTTTDAVPVSTTWIMKNGVVVAKQGDPIFPGSTENWSTFRDVKGDSCGNFVINGSSNITDSLLNDVIVYNARKLIARESDGVDLNNDGLNNDSLFLHIIQDRAILLDDDFYYISTRLKNSATATAGVGGSTASSLLRVRVCRADFDYSGTLAIDDIFIFLNAWFALDPRANWNCADGLTVDDIFIYINSWFGGC